MPAGMRTGESQQAAGVGSGAHFKDAASHLCAAVCGPLGPDGKPLRACAPEFRAAYLGIAAGGLARAGELKDTVCAHWVAGLGRVQLAMAGVCEHPMHWSAPF